MFHLALHALVPLVIALGFYPRTWRKHYLLMMAGMLIDLDHLLADPIYDPDRCSLGFHPLHTGIPALLYGAALIPRRTRALGLGLCVHLALDGLDCRITSGIWFSG